MNIVSTFLYYVIFSSSVLFYGIGLNQTVEIGHAKVEKFTSLLKVFISIYASSILSYLVTSKILVKLELVEIFPIVCLLIFVSINGFLEALIRIITGLSATEFIISWLVVVLSVSESTSFINSIIICTSCLLSFMIIAPIVYSFRRRVYIENRLKERHYSLIMFFLCVLILLISAFDIGWLNPGVIE